MNPHGRRRMCVIGRGEIVDKRCLCGLDSHPIRMLSPNGLLRTSCSHGCVANAKEDNANVVDEIVPDVGKTARSDNGLVAASPRQFVERPTVR